MPGCQSGHRWRYTQVEIIVGQPVHYLYTCEGCQAVRKEPMLREEEAVSTKPAQHPILAAAKVCLLILMAFILLDRCATFLESRVNSDSRTYYPAAGSEAYPQN